MNDAEPKRQGQIQQQIENCQNDVGDLSELISKLASILNPILRDPKPEAAAETSKDEYIVPIASEIRSLDFTILYQKDRINDLIRNIKLFLLRNG